jgi:hypothetical protein
MDIYCITIIYYSKIKKYKNKMINNELPESDIN